MFINFAIRKTHYNWLRWIYFIYFRGRYNHSPILSNLLVICADTHMTYFSLNCLNALWIFWHNSFWLVFNDKKTYKCSINGNKNVNQNWGLNIYNKPLCLTNKRNTKSSTSLTHKPCVNDEAADYSHCIWLHFWSHWSSFPSVIGG